MNEDTLNMEIRKYLKQVGVTSQREIEHAVFKAVDSKALQGNEAVAIKMTLEIQAIGLNHCIEGTIELE
ncbi:MAG: DUF6494 family protein [Methylovulum sp.]|uniref:DUF6494 family protein n=1 Tax=Methylovulum sp. TaxID=1916980 RepID=UPI0026101BF6|nr:DUF6494 family protein [Methylovulum sp.]MDD2724943.1 DUF6494 family protein [Methylovulum sp.]MDD5123533.1 DUF6494 family protein [Methylovulum sp.]